MAKSLTERQTQVLKFIRNSIEQHGVAPTAREIAAELHVESHRGVAKHLDALVKKGMISIREGSHRSIRLLEEAGILIPIYGKVAAGKPIEASEHVVRSIPVPTGLFRRDPDFFYTVEGDSMVDAMIFDGDLAGFHKAETAESGQIVLAHVRAEEMSRDEAASCGIARNGLTIKRVSISGSKIVLKSQNRAKAYSPFVLDPDLVSIEGIFQGTVRAA